MDAELVLATANQIRGGHVTMQSLVQLAMEAEQLATKACALASTITDGAVYRLEQNGVKSPKDYAYLQFVLASLKDAGQQLEKSMSAALTSETGHARRFAELLQETGVTKVSYDELGTFYIATSLKAVPPSKESPDYEAFRQWCRDRNIATESYNWRALQTAAEAGQQDGSLPAYIKVSPSSEVRLRK